MASLGRVLLRKRTHAPILAGAAAGTSLCLLSLRKAYAEAPPASTESEFETATRERKPIYDSNSSGSTYLPSNSRPAFSPQTSALYDSPSQGHAEEDSKKFGSGPTPTDQLAAQIRQARLFLHAHLALAEDRFNDFMSQSLALEHSFTETMASLAPRPEESEEKLASGSVYVLVAGMAGSILARNRGFLLRTATPLGLALGTAYAVLPKTMENVENLVYGYEKRFLPPAVLEAQVFAKSFWKEGSRQLNARTKTLQTWTEQSARDGRAKLEETFFNSK